MTTWHIIVIGAVAGLVLAALWQIVERLDRIVKLLEARNRD